MKLEDRVRKKIVQAINDFGMIDDWDKIILWVSGWKDSMLLAYMLSEIRKRSKKKFEIIWVYIYKKFLITCEVDFTERMNFFEKIWIPLETVEINLPEESKLNQWVWLSCQWCAYARRIALMKLADKRKANKICLWHHLDDEVITLYMNILEWSRFKIMDPINRMDKMDVAFIRPLSYIRERDIKELCKTLEIPFSPCLCPIWEQWRRKKIKTLLEWIEALEPEFMEKMYFSVIKELYKDILDKNK